MRNLSVITLLLWMPLAWSQDDSTTTSAPDEVVVVCPIIGDIDQGNVVVVERALEEARDLKADAVIFRVDTPGGRIDSAIKIATAIQNASCKTVALIEGMGAISAGAMIIFACDEILMTPGSNIGAANPVSPSSEELKPNREKEVSFLRAKMRALAESRGHNPDIAMAMVDKNIELCGLSLEDGRMTVYAARQITEPEDGGPKPEILTFEDGSTLISARGKLLTLTPREGLLYCVIETTVADLEAVLEHMNLENASLHVIEQTSAERVFQILSVRSAVGFLLLLGIVGLVVHRRSRSIA